jgi:hypothetical protein
MKKVLCRSLVLALGMALVASAASAKRGGGYAGYQRESLTNGVRVGPMDQTIRDAQFAGAALTTTALYNQTFDVGASCSEAGWTKVDGTSQIQVFWHVDDFAGASVTRATRSRFRKALARCGAVLASRPPAQRAVTCSCRVTATTGTVVAHEDVLGPRG